MISPNNKLIEESSRDLYEDFEELLYLLTSQRNKVGLFISDVEKVKPALRASVVTSVLGKASKLIAINERYAKEIRKNTQATQTVASIKHLDRLYQEKLRLFELIRIHYNETAALITSIDWQSPSFLHTKYAMAGKQTGRIVGTENDYKRDQHLDGLAFQNKFKQEYIDSFFKMAVQVFATNSGMAAFTAILSFLQMSKKITGPVLIGKSIYFENKTLVKNSIHNVVEVDENDTSKVCAAIETLQPSVVILDSLSNSAHIPVPNLPEIIKCLTKAKKHTYLLVDNTGLSISNQVLQQTIGKSVFLHTIVFESLNKYYQFGMDRVTGGILWIHGKEGYGLFRAREFTGTNMGDTSSYAIPTPNRKLLTKRLARLERNTTFIANQLQQYVDTHETVLSHIAYPGLPNHPSFPWTHYSSFHGSFLTLAFKHKFQTVTHYKNFVKLVIKEAKEQNVDIVSGTSFGFNTTRVYLTALHSDFGEPFVRLSVGTEPIYYLEKIRNVFISVINRM